MNFVVVRPPEGLGDCRRVRRLPSGRSRPNHCNPWSMRCAREMLAGRGLLFNRLQAAAEQLSPWIARLGRLMAGEDCLGHGMSGSGTAYFGLFRSAPQARRVARRLLPAVSVV